MPQMGLLFVINEPPAAMEDELNAWYDTDHIPERLAIKGFLSAVRYVSAERQRRYLALYDLSDIGVLQSDEYKAYFGEKFTPWTRRIVTRTKVTRLEAVQSYPGDAQARPSANFLVLRFAGVSGADASLVEQGARACFLDRPGVNQLRIFAGSGDDQGTHIVIIGGTGELKALFDPEAFSEAAKHLDLVEAYLPY
jgi:hypothetical protein